MRPSALLAAAGLLAPLGSAARGLPKYRASEDDSVPQLIRITALVIDAATQTPSLQCWEVSETASGSSSRMGKSGRGRHLSRLSLGSTEDSDLDDVSLFAWGPHGDIFSSADDYSTRAASAFIGFNFFNLMSGAISIEGKWNNTSVWTNDKGERIYDDDEEGTAWNYFGPDNGDNWFYFEDASTQSASVPKTRDSEVEVYIKSVSGGNTQMLAISHSQRPSYKVVHEGPCSYTGVRTPPATKGPKTMNSKGKHIDVSLNIQEL